MRTSVRSTAGADRQPATSSGPRGAAIRRPAGPMAFVVRPSGDHLERQADHAAASAVDRLTAPASGANAPPPVQLQSERVSGEGGLKVPPAIQAELAAALQNGRSMEPEVQTAMETAIGADLGEVRIHNDGRSHALSQALQAHAFTTGQHVFFNQGAYDPSRTEGRRLLAHELAHAVQQGSAPQAIQRVKIAGKQAVTGLLAFQIGGDRFSEVMDILNGPLKDEDYVSNEAARQAVDGVLAACDVYSKKGPLTIEGTGGRRNVHLTHAAVIGYFRKHREDITEGEEQSMAIGEGRLKKNKLYGQILYSNTNGLVRYWHAHDAGKMG